MEQVAPDEDNLQNIWDEGVNPEISIDVTDGVSSNQNTSASSLTPDEE